MDFRKISIIVALLAALFAFSAAPVIAQDMSDNATCAECHEGGGSDEPMDVPGAQVHNPDGTFVQEGHVDWSCTDCHSDIEEVPHKEGVERTVDCQMCHDETPE